MPRSARRRGTSRLGEWSQVAAGGAIGAPLRHALDQLAIGATGGSPLFEPILAVNVLGAGALGVLLGALERGRGPLALRPFLAVGLLGGFTTWSTLVLQTHALAHDVGPGWAVAKLVGSLVLGLGAFAVGERWGGGAGAGQAAAR